MNIEMLEAMGFTPEKILQNPEMLRKFIPLLDELKKTFLKEGETDIILMAGLEANEPIIRVVAIKPTEDKKGLQIVRQITKPNEDPNKAPSPLHWNAFDFLKLVGSVQKEQNGKGEQSSLNFGNE